MFCEEEIEVSLRGLETIIIEEMVWTPRVRASKITFIQVLWVKGNLQEEEKAKNTQYWVFFRHYFFGIFEKLNWSIIKYPF